MSDRSEVCRLVEVESMEQISALFGNLDENAQVIMEETGAKVGAKDHSIAVTGKGENVELAALVIEKLLALISGGEMVDKKRIRYAVDLARKGTPS